MQIRRLRLTGDARCEHFVNNVTIDSRVHHQDPFSAKVQSVEAQIDVDQLQAILIVADCSSCLTQQCSDGERQAARSFKYALHLQFRSKHSWAA